MQFAPRAINFTYYAGIMLDALAHLLCKNYASIIDAGLLQVSSEEVVLANEIHMPRCL